MADTASARERAIERLSRIEDDGAFVSRLASDALDELDAREERQAAEYVAGITRRRRWLDFLIAHFYRGDAETLESTLRQILRLGLYDLLVLSTAPHAAVNESVALAKRLVRPGAGGLVNGILRAAQRSAASLPEPSTGDPIEDIAISESFPSWLVRRLAGQLGLDGTVGLLRASNERPAFTLRLNTLKAGIDEHFRRLDDLGIGWAKSTWLDDFVVVEALQPVLRAGWLEQGWCAVQDEAAGLVVRLLDPQPDEVVADLASAPGGKAIYAAMRMQNRGRVIAVDVHRRRLELVAAGARAHGLSIVETLVADATELACGQDTLQADRVLLDAPCSGIGVLGKRADLRWRLQPGDFQELCKLQSDLLQAAASVVRPGGVLVYSTCTLDESENQRQVQAFLASRPEFSVESASAYVPDEMTTSEGYYLALPHVHGTDGAFAVRLRRS